MFNIIRGAILQDLRVADPTNSVAVSEQKQNAIFSSNAQSLCE
jgi:hypothetical protein